MASPDSNLSTVHQQPGDTKRSSDTLDRGQAPDHTDPAKGSPAKGAHQFGGDGGDRGAADKGK